MFMRLYTALYHAFMPPLYAGTLYQGLSQVYDTRAPLAFIPGLPVVSLLSPCGLPVACLWSPCGLPVARHGLDWLGLASIGCVGSNLPGLYLGLATFLMNSVLPVCFLAAYAVALFCFMLVLYSTRRGAI